MSGSRGAIARVFDTYRDLLIRRAHGILGSYEDARDVVQDVMLLLLEGPDILPDIENLVGWLYTVVKRRCVDLVRSGTRRRSREERAVSLESVISSIDDPEILVEEADFLELIVSIISRLSPGQREALIESEIHELSFREISAKTGVPMGTLMARKKRALDSIRRSLDLLHDTEDTPEGRT